MEDIVIHKFSIYLTSLQSTHKKILCALIFLFLQGLAFSQENNFQKENEKVWFTLGLDPFLFSAAQASVNFPTTEHSFFSIRTAGVNDQVLKHVTLIGLIDGARYSSDLGLLYG